jgi:hypothetical protein
VEPKNNRGLAAVRNLVLVIIAPIKLAVATQVQDLLADTKRSTYEPGITRRCS